VRFRTDIVRPIPARKQERARCCLIDVVVIVARLQSWGEDFRMPDIGFKLGEIITNLGKSSRVPVSDNKKKSLPVVRNERESHPTHR
jgi:hypothetical protein